MASFPEKTEPWHMELSVYYGMVCTGKPLAWAYPTRSVEEARAYCEEMLLYYKNAGADHGVKFHVRETEFGTEVFFYKDERVFKLFLMSEERFPVEDPFRHVVWGHLFGYSNAEIMNHLTSVGLV